MKKTISMFLLISLLCSSIAFAAASDVDFSSLSEDELTALRASINDELASRIIVEQTELAALPETITLREIFPCLDLAKSIRDRLGLVSIDQPVTQEALDSITSLSRSDFPSDSVIDDITGVGYLTNLKEISFLLNECAKDLSFIPDDLYSLEKLENLFLHETKVASLSSDIGNLHSLKELWLSSTDIADLPDAIGDLVSLEKLYLHNTNISELPDTLCNLTRLKKLILNDTKISALPDDIGNLTSLEELNISNTNISSLPPSIYNLTLSEFKKNGLDIE